MAPQGFTFPSLHPARKANNPSKVIRTASRLPIRRFNSLMTNPTLGFRNGWSGATELCVCVSIPAIPSEPAHSMVGHDVMRSKGKLNG
jgi:hypothetical protein